MKTTIEKIREFYINNRLEQVDKDFLDYEERLSKQSDLEKLLGLLEDKKKISNIHNSIIVYITGLSDEFDFKKARSDMKGGAFPDIDMDYDPLKREYIFEHYKQVFGKECVAQIGAYGKFHLQSIAQDITRISEPLEPKKSDYEDEKDFLVAQDSFRKDKKEIWDNFQKLDQIIPPNKYGLPPSYEDMIKDVPAIEKDFPEYCEIAKYADDMRKQFGVHAAGIVVADFPINDLIPLWKNDKYEQITQFDKDEVEALGLIKFDELVVDALSVTDETLRLVEKDTGLKIDLEKDIYEKDGDELAYKVLNNGLMAGIWQMETSPKAKELILAIKPETINHLADITSLNRPGPLDNGLDKDYIKNRKSGIPDDVPEIVAKVLEKTYGVLVYQEQVMKLCVELAGFSLSESNNVRKALGKKKFEDIIKYKSEFIDRAEKKGLVTRQYASDLWDKIEKFAFYAFNLSHAAGYSMMTYATAYLKGNYPLQFYTALMTIKSQEMAPEKWQSKISEYAEELKFFNIKIAPPDINNSNVGFYYIDDIIYFGLAGIKTIAKSSADAIIKAREKGKFKDVHDFLLRVNRTKLNSGKFEALIKAGCFDRMGYLRKDLLDNKNSLYNYFNEIEEYKVRIKEIKERNIKREQILKAREEGEKVTEKLPVAIKLKEEPKLPIVEQHKKIRITVPEILEQAEFLGCFLGYHPAELLKGEFTNINKVWIGETHTIRGIIKSIKKIKDRNGNNMAFISIEDHTTKGEATIFSSVFNKISNLLEVNKLIKAVVRVESEQPVKMIINKLEIVTDL